MQLEEKTKTGSKEYCCSNPNCNNVFSYPKIIKYYVCPSCQSLVKMEGVTSQPIIETTTSAEKGGLVEDFDSIGNQKIDEINKLKTKNSNLNQKLESTKKDLYNSQEQTKSITTKIMKMAREIVDLREKNLDLSKQTKLLEIKRTSNSAKIRKDADKIVNLEETISNKNACAETMNSRLGDLKEKVQNLTEQKEAIIIEKNKAITNQLKTEKIFYKETEEKDKIQTELTTLKEKLADFTRKDNELTKKRLLEAKKISVLELEIKTLKEKKQIKKTKIPKSKNISFDHTIEKVQDLNLKIKTRKQEKSTKFYALNASKHKYPKQVTPNKDKEEPKSSTGCGFYLGYLSERDKGEKIPNTCVECSKSLDCMLTKVRQSNKSVKEIKKWYHFK